MDVAARRHTLRGRHGVFMGEGADVVVADLVAGEDRGGGAEAA